MLAGAWEKLTLWSPEQPMAPVVAASILHTLLEDPAAERGA